MNDILIDLEDSLGKIVLEGKDEPLKARIFFPNYVDTAKITESDRLSIAFAIIFKIQFGRPGLRQGYNQHCLECMKHHEVGVQWRVDVAESDKLVFVPKSNQRFQPTPPARPRYKRYPFP